MAKRTQEPPEIPATLSKEQGLRALAVMKEKGEKLLANRPIQESQFETWWNSSIDFIEKVFGSRLGHGHTRNFVGPMYGGYHGSDERYKENQRATDLVIASSKRRHALQNPL